MQHQMQQMQLAAEPGQQVQFKEDPSGFTFPACAPVKRIDYIFLMTQSCDAAGGGAPVPALDVCPVGGAEAGVGAGAGGCQGTLSDAPAAHPAGGGWRVRMDVQRTYIAGRDPSATSGAGAVLCLFLCFLYRMRIDTLPYPFVVADAALLMLLY